MLGAAEAKSADTFKLGRLAGLPARLIPRIIGLTSAALFSALFWGVVLKEAAAGLGHGLSNLGVTFAVAPIALFLMAILAPIMLPDDVEESALRAGQLDAVADAAVMVLDSVTAKGATTTPRRRASSA